MPAATLRRGGGGGGAGRGRLPSAGHMRGAGGWAEAVAAAGAEVGLGGEGRGCGAQQQRAAAVVAAEKEEEEEKKEKEKEQERPRGAERVERAPGLSEPRPPRSALPAVPTWTKRVAEVAAVSAGLVPGERGPSAGAAGSRTAGAPESCCGRGPGPCRRCCPVPPGNPEPSRCVGAAEQWPGGRGSGHNGGSVSRGRAGSGGGAAGPGAPGGGGAEQAGPGPAAVTAPCSLLQLLLRCQRGRGEIGKSPRLVVQERRKE